MSNLTKAAYLHHCYHDIIAPNSKGYGTNSCTQPRSACLFSNPSFSLCGTLHFLLVHWTLFQKQWDGLLLPVALSCIIYTASKTVWHSLRASFTFKTTIIVCCRATFIYHNLSSLSLFVGLLSRSPSCFAYLSNRRSS